MNIETLTTFFMWMSIILLFRLYKGGSISPFATDGGMLPPYKQK